MITTARVYDRPGPEAGHRVLVDRLWPRGMRKDDAPVDEWCKDVAPSTELRQWYGHDRERTAEFRERYVAELAEPVRAAALDHLRRLVAAGDVVLLSSTTSLDISHVAVLADLLG